MRRSRVFRWAGWSVAAALIVTVAAAAVRLSLLDGWLRTVRIEGASMAPTLCGTHLAVTCTDCGFSFRCDAEHLPESGRLVCPNCGFRELHAQEFPAQPGDAVLVDRWPLVSASPRRWDIVAFDDPLAGGMSVKRVAGLPGERLSIRGGDLYADGQIVRKTLADFKRVAVLVHDNDRLPSSVTGKGSPRFLRWQPQSARSGWMPAAGGFRHVPNSAGGGPDWLEYIHWRCDASLTPREQPAAILDNDPYNQGQPRLLNPVHDLILSCDVRFPASGELMLALPSRGAWLEVEIAVGTGTISASQDGRKLASALLPRRPAGSRLRLEFGQFDGQLALAIAGEEVLLQTLAAVDPGSAGAARSTSPLQIACVGEGFEITRLQLWRDVYLLEPGGTDRDWRMETPLKGDEFLVLGDNPPVSIDGRHWSHGGLERARLRGVVSPPR